VIAHEEGPVARLRERLLNEIEILRHRQPDRPPSYQQPSISLNH
jgi:hypothetical protein